MTPLPHSQVGSPPTWIRFRRLPSPVPSRGPSIGCQPTLQGIQKPRVRAYALSLSDMAFRSSDTRVHPGPSDRGLPLKAHPLSSGTLFAGGLSISFDLNGHHPTQGYGRIHKRVVQTLPCRLFMPPLSRISLPPRDIQPREGP